MLATDINMLFACALSSSHTNQLRERWKDGRKGGGKKGKEDREKENASGDGKRERERERERESRTFSKHVTRARQKQIRHNEFCRLRLRTINSSSLDGSAAAVAAVRLMAPVKAARAHLES